MLYNSVTFLLVCLCVPVQVHSKVTADDPGVLTVLALCSVVGTVLAVLVTVLVCLLSNYCCCDGKMPRLLQSLSSNDITLSTACTSFKCRCGCMQGIKGKCSWRRQVLPPSTLTFSVDRQTAAMLEQLFNDPDEKPATVTQNAPILCGSPPSEVDTVNSPVTRTFNVGRQTPREVLPPAVAPKRVRDDTLTVDRSTHEFLQQMYEDMDTYSLEEYPAVPPAFNPTDEGHTYSAVQEPHTYQPLLESSRDEIQEAYQDVRRGNHSETSSVASYQNVEVFLGRHTGHESYY